ncbi:MAG: type II toxin-antitoxin system HicB family antitoxin [Candidatus Hydrogenedentales bacterium]
MKLSAYRIQLQAEPEGGFTVTVPTLPGCVTWGRDFDHAIEMAKECIEGHLEALRDVGEPIPEETIDTTAELIIQVTAPAEA